MVPVGCLFEGLGLWSARASSSLVATTACLLPAATAPYAHVPRPQHNFFAAFGPGTEYGFDAAQYCNSRNLVRFGSLSAHHDEGLTCFEVSEREGRHPLEHLLEISLVTSRHAASPLSPAGPSIASEICRAASLCGFALSLLARGAVGRRSGIKRGNCVGHFRSQFVQL